MGKKALVLSGGSIKGAFQAGAIKQVLDEGFEPDIIHGVSVGALNGGFLANEIGKLNNEYDWKDIGDVLVDFWRQNIVKPSDLIKKRKKLRLGIDIITNNFKGVVSSYPLQKLVKRLFSLENLRKSEIDFTAGAVDMVSGKLRNFNSLDSSLIDGILASAALPIVMPVSDINNTPFYDGGLRDVAPLKGVIEKGADDIVIILCQPEELSSRNFDTGNLLHLVSRIMDVIVNETVNNDIQKLRKVNSRIPDHNQRITEGEYIGKRKIKYRVIRPHSNLNVKIDKFNRRDIDEMIALGQLTARKSNWVS